MSKNPNIRWQRFSRAAGLRFTGKDVLLAAAMLFSVLSSEKVERYR